MTAQTQEDAATRTTLNGFRTEWVTGDKIGVFSTQAGASNAPLTAASAGATSAFNGEMTWGTGTHDFYAYYPHVAGSFDYTAIPVSLPANQTQSSGGSTAHPGALDFMVAQPLTDVAPGGNVQFQFRHLFTLLEFRVLGSGEVSKIEIRASGNRMLSTSSGKTNISQADPTLNQVGYNWSPSVSLSLNTPATLTKNKDTTSALYMMIYMTNSDYFIGEELTITATIDGQPKTITTDGFRMERGKKYTLVVDPDKDVEPKEDVLTMIPDSKFLEYCRAQMDTWDKNGDGKLTLSEAATVTGMDVSGNSNDRGEISSLKGIEYFTGITSLYCHYNQLSSLDVSKNTALRQLGCGINQLTSLDVSKNTALTDLSCGYNQLTSLDVYKNTVLTSLTCYGIQLTSLDVSKNTLLTYLYCSGSQLTSLDVSKNTALIYLICDNNRLTSLDISKNTALTWFQCQTNPGDGVSKLPVKAWFDNSGIPTDFTTGSWTLGSNTITVDYYTGDAPAPGEAADD